MTDAFNLKQIQTAEMANYVAPSPVPQGESLEDEVFQALFVSTIDFQAALKVFGTAHARYMYIDVGYAFKEMIKPNKEEIADLDFKLQAEMIGRDLLKDLFFVAVFNSEEGQETPAYIMHSQNIK